MKKYAIIVAGGSGTRAGGSIPKQLQPLAGRPVFIHAMEAFLDEDADTHIILVTNAAYTEFFRSYVDEVRLRRSFSCSFTEGGSTRSRSVINALRLIAEPACTLMAVHDAARPLVSPAMIRRGWQTASEHGAAVPAVPLTDSIRRLTDGGSVSVPRSEYVAVQTPQVFAGDILVGAYTSLSEEDLDAVTDDASAVEMSGRQPALYDGEPTNIKITGPHDLRIAEFLMQKP